MGVVSNKHRAKVAPADIVDHPPIVRMPPKRQYTVKVRITKVRKAEPRVVAPDEEP